MFTKHRAQRWKKRSRAYGLSCSRWTRSASTITSSSWAVIRSWQLGWSPESDKFFTASCRFAHYLKCRRWPAYRITLRRSDAQEMNTNRRFKKARIRQKKSSYDNRRAFDASSQTERYYVRGQRSAHFEGAERSPDGGSSSRIKRTKG